MIEKVNLESMDIIQDNIEKLKQIFPEIFSENKIDFEALKSVLGEEIDTENERYSFNWHGKSNARRIALEPSMGTLLPSKSESKNWESTENMYIEGDNLEVLKLLQKSYHNKIKMIYIDPPYNTGKDFVYKDNFKDNLKNYLDITGQTGAEGQKLSTNSDTSGRYHSDWLNMMYPRLKLARNLLTDDGFIFISIDDNEITNLKKICDEIFGEENFINKFVWKRNSSGKTEKEKFTLNTEYILFYSKGVNYILNNAYKPLAESSQKLYNKDDFDGRGKYQTVSLQKPKDPGPETKYDYLDNNGKLWACPPKGWRMKYEKIKALENENRVVFTGKTLRAKDYWNEREDEGKRIDTLWDDLPENSKASKDLEKIFKIKDLFTNPKPFEVIKRCLNISGNSKLISLDFFSGSATTAHAVMQLNAEDGGNRKHIMVQIPETTDEKTEAFKAGYKTICEIGKERIRRAGEKIKSDESLPLENREKLDIGFKVFKLDTSNIKEWDSETEDLNKSLFASIDNIKTERTSLDILYEVLLKYGLDLNVPIVKKENFYSINTGTLLINLEKEITLDAIDSMCEEYKNLIKLDEDYKTTVVLRDNSFKNNVDKTNAIQRLKQAGIKEIRSI